MIVVAEEAGLRLITQPDHARLAADILSLWRADEVAARADREELIFATREHDNGWREADAAPSVDRASGRPLDYLGVPAGYRREIWLRGTARFVEDHPWAALLILEHGLALHRDRRGDEAWDEFLEVLEARRQDILETLDVEAADVQTAYTRLALADTLSLALCHRREGVLELQDHRARIAGDELTLDPFPLAGSTTFRVPCRLVPARRYSGDADLGGELAGARWRALEVRIVPENEPIGHSGAGPGVIP